MESLKERFRSAKVLVIGDVMLDEYIVGAVSRICPEAPVPVLDVRSHYNSPGGAANVAINVSGLGAAAHLVGVVGDDPAGRSLRQLLQQNGIPDNGLIDADGRGTISKTRIIAGQQQICRIDHETTTDVPDDVLERLIDAVKRFLDVCSVVVLSDYAKGTLTGRFCQNVISSACKAGKPVIVDPKSRTLGKYRGCSVITPNVTEASQASGIEINSEGSLREAGTVLIGQLPGTSVLITRGADGMALFQPGTEPISIPTVARRVFDVVGAGDTVVATLAVALASGLLLREAVAWSNVGAGIVVEKPGTASISLDELFRASQDRFDSVRESAL